MHDTAYRIGGLVIQSYSPRKKASILEIGAHNINGSLRDFATPSTRYVGMDFDAGHGVDIVLKPGEPWPVEDDDFDLVIASSVFEHDVAFWLTFLAMCRKAKPGGFIYVSAPSNGKVHRYPQDYWRFYPDAGLALECWAEREGIEITLVESFIAEREGDEWNDFCAVFRREPSSDVLSEEFVYARVPCTNVLTWKSSDVEVFGIAPRPRDHTRPSAARP
jgi:SAM-dependent methyltransferase